VFVPFQSSLTFAGNTRSIPKKEASERCSIWVGSGLALKVKDLTESLLGLVISDKGKKFYNIDTRSSGKEVKWRERQKKSYDKETKLGLLN
jgi:hypothetical protein